MITPTLPPPLWCVFYSISTPLTSVVWEIFPEVVRGGKVGQGEGRLQEHHSQGKGREVSLSSRRPQTSGQASANSGSPPCRGFQSPCLECTEVKKSNLVPSTARSSPMRGCSRSSSYVSTRSSSHSSRSPNPRASPRYTRSRSTSSGKR